MIKFLFMDVDGTLTDGKIYMGCNGEIAKSFSIKDGYGLSVLAKGNGITPIIITGRKSHIVVNRCKELGISEVFQSVADKQIVIESLINKYKCNIYNVAYIGDDLNDLNAINYVLKGGGIVGCPNDAAKEIVKVSNYVSEYTGGNGAVRDFIEYLININSEC